MDSYDLFSFSIVVGLALVHYISAKLAKANWLWHGRFLSLAGGVSVSYVFIDILPKLCESQETIRSGILGAVPFLEKHVYVLALTGMLFFYAVEHQNQQNRSLHKSMAPFWASIGAYSILNFLVGYAVCDRHDPEIQPLALFGFAIGLHFFINDHTLFLNYFNPYQQIGRNLLVASLFLGWFIGLSVQLSAQAIAMVVAFIAGGMIMNVMHYELPNGYRPKSLKPFIVGAIGYTIILLFLGSKASI